MKHLRLWAAGYAAALTAFTAFIALDTFVLSDAIQTDVTGMNLSVFTDQTADAEAGEDAESSAASSGAAVRSRHQRAASQSGVTASAYAESSTAAASEYSTYSDENITVQLTTYEAYDTQIYVADVQLSSAQYLKTAFANDTFGKNITAATSDTAAAHDAILAVNGDFYGTQEKGYVIRNGVVYRGTSSGEDLLCIYADGTMKIVSSDEKSAEQLVEDGVWQALCFGPALLEEGQISVSETEEVGHAMASNPRTAIGMIDPLHYVFVVSDGRTNESAGLTLYQLAEFMQSLGAETAYNLDGGGSSTMYYQGEIVNNPTTNGKTIKERGVSDIVYIG